jgi:hypothetical protein
VHRPTVAFFLLLFLFTLCVYSSPQDTGPSLPSAVPRSHTEPDVPTEIQKEMEKKANLQRQADLKRDADTLLKLSTELKAYVDKTNENVMSVEVIKKAEEIEKLAHSVKTKMRGDY